MNGFETPFEDFPEAQAAPVLSSDGTEQAVLSVLANFPDVYDEICDRLTADCFAGDEHRRIFQVLQQQILARRGMDVVSVVLALAGEMDSGYVHGVLSSNDFSARGIHRHVDTLVDLHKSRQLRAVGFKISELAHGDGPVSDRIDQAQTAIQALEVQGGEDDWVDAYTAAMAHTELLEARQEGKVSGMPTGLYGFDEMLDGGLVRGNLIVIGARPSMGKTAFAMTVGLSMASQQCVGMLSMEMPHNDVRDRQAAILGRIAISAIKRPNKPNASGETLDYSRIVDAVELSRNLRWFVSDRSGLNIQQVRSMARKLKRTKKLDVLIVDYIGLMEGLDKKQSRAYQIEEISRGLKALAKELDIAVVCLAQVNRCAAEKAMQPPGLHELRDSGAIEQDADVVAFIHRPIMANPQLDPKWTNYAMLRIAKNRQGRTGDMHLYYRGETTTFESWGGDVPTLSPVAAPAGAARSRGME
ncbi:MAG: AAA family ATPase [Delftia lacustris]|uniref:replicative DNA helicase n=1 Tax=Delftia TaxID=80865 RepID=UPI00259C700F|nr:DnaB-like helicase C-terminal domain-containing protein [Delftia sp.]